MHTASILTFFLFLLSGTALAGGTAAELGFPEGGVYDQVHRILHPELYEPSKPQTIEPGLLTLAVPSGSRIFIDGMRFDGLVLERIELKPGPHEILVISVPLGIDETHEVEVESGGAYTIEVAAPVREPVLETLLPEPVVQPEPKVSKQAEPIAQRARSRKSKRLTKPEPKKAKEQAAPPEPKKPAEPEPEPTTAPEPDASPEPPAVSEALRTSSVAFEAKQPDLVEDVSSPLAPKDPQVPPQSLAEKSKPPEGFEMKTYTVAKGETIESVAAVWDIASEDIRAWNEIDKDEEPEVGRGLVLWVPPAPGALDRDEDGVPDDRDKCPDAWIGIPEDEDRNGCLD